MLAATDAAAEWSDRRACRIVKRVWIKAVRRSSSAFLAPRIARSKSRSPSPDFRNDSRIELSDDGGAGYH